jgi:hypothetical protein
VTLKKEEEYLLFPDARDKYFERQPQPWEVMYSQAVASGSVASDLLDQTIKQTLFCPHLIQ